MKPRLDRRKSKAILNYKGTQTFIGEGELHGVGHPDFPGGCGVNTSIWKFKYDNSIYWNRVEKAVRRYKKIRRMGVAEYGITLAPLQDHVNR